MTPADDDGTEDGLAVSVHGATSSAPGRVRRADGLPLELTSFVGRTAEVADVVQAIGTSRLVTVTGPGGIGKTRLAVAVASVVAADFADGVLFVDLTRVAAGSDVVSAVTDLLRLEPAGGQSAIGALAAFVAQRQVLLVLDNCEHVIAGCREMVAGLLSATTAARVLGTSRERLAMLGEHVIRLRPLSQPVPSDRPMTLEVLRRSEAVQLLESRARLVFDGFTLGERDVASVSELCARLDGLPLAIELAAGRLGSLGLVEMNRRLEDRFDVLNRGDPTARSTHQTMRAVVGWSWDLCSSAEQALWARMSVFSGGADLGAITFLCTAQDVGAVDVLDALDGLVSKSVLLFENDGRSTRYRMLETLRGFGREQLNAAGEWEARADQHAQYYSSLAAQSAREFYSEDQASWAWWLRTESSNLASAVERLLSDDHRTDDALRLVTSLRYHWMMNAACEGRQVVQRALDRYPRPDEIRIEGLLGAAHGLVLLGASSRAAECCAEATSLAQTLGSRRWQTRASAWSALVHYLGGEHDRAEAEEAEVASQLAAADEREWRFGVLIGRAFSRTFRGDLVGAREDIAQLMREGEACGDRWMRGTVSQLAAMEAWTRGSRQESRTAAARGVGFFGELGDRFGVRIILTTMIGLEAEVGEHRRAAVLLGASGLIAELAELEIGNFAALSHRTMAVVPGVEAALGQEGFAAAYGEGVEMSLAQLRRFLADVRQPQRAPPASSEANGPLTARELEVARLVATGMTNRSIAAQLFLSPRTIDGHLERILAKLGFRSRAEVAAWVAVREDSSGADGR